MIIYQIAICDDEPFFLESTSNMVSEVLTEEGIPYEISKFTNSLKLLTAIENTPNRFHLLILDIMMKEKSGLEIAEHLRISYSPISILFTTAFKDFAIDSYKVYPVHYLIKPLEKPLMVSALKKDYTENCRPKNVLIKGKNSTMITSLDSIFYVESLNRQIIVHERDKEFHSIETLKSWKIKLNKDFFIQCHRSYLISMVKIKSISRQNVILCNDKMLPMGRKYYQSVFTQFIDFMSQK